MEIKLKYGNGYKTAAFPDDAAVTVLKTREMPVKGDVEKALTEALDHPIGADRLEQRPAPASVAIAVPDETRPTPLKQLLPPLLDRLFAAYPSLGPRDVVVVVGGGLHPAPDAGQLARVLPEDMRGCRVVAHDALRSAMKSYGLTSRGTPVEINAEFAAAELKIVIGQIDPHQFVGFTGGAKGAVVGLASKAMIQASHRFMSDPGAKVGQIEGNPVRQDLNEAGAMIGVDLAINVVLNPAKDIVALLAGEPVEVLRQGAEVSARVYGLAFDQPFDIVVASCGGAPKDICLYQAQKGLNQASQCLKPGGKILLLAACAQGVGDEVYHDYVRRFPTAQAQMREFEENGFRMGAHKSYLFSRTVTRYDVVVVSDMKKELLAECHLVKGELQETLDRWLAEFPGSPRIAVVPSANTTFFQAKNPG